jgi:D-serine deaminase-like pyridoxal phosphate-dependent protein
MLSDDPIDTPALVLDLNRLERNLGRLARDCAAAGVGFRPHAKAHKSPWVAARQLAHGAVGLCAAKLGEAEVLIRGGVPDVLVTTELEPAKFDRLLSLCGLGKVSVVADDPLRVSALAAAASARGIEVPVLVDVDVAGRTGVETEPQAVEVARAASAPGTRFVGLQGFEGHLQQIVDPQTRRAGALEAYERLAGCKAALERAGFDVQCISVAGTGTYKFALEHGLATEVQAGSYAFYDSRYATLKDLDFENALFVVAGVVSTRSNGELIIDAGLKALSTDDGFAEIAGEPHATYEPAGDEHGRVRGLPQDTERVWLTPSHCDTTVNLHSHYVLLKDGRVTGEIPVAARARTQ